MQGGSGPLCRVAPVSPKRPRAARSPQGAACPQALWPQNRHKAERDSGFPGANPLVCTRFSLAALPLPGPAASHQGSRLDSQII